MNPEESRSSSRSLTSELSSLPMEQEEQVSSVQLEELPYEITQAILRRVSVMTVERSMYGFWTYTIRSFAHDAAICL